MGQKPVDFKVLQLVPLDSGEAVQALQTCWELVADPAGPPMVMVSARDLSWVCVMANLYIDSGETT